MPDPAKDRVVSVEVVLHPPGGGRADDASVTAEHIASLTVPAETMQRVQGWFTAHGLETGPSGPISFSVTGPAAALAEALRLDDPTSERLAAPPAGGEPALSLPLHALPPEVRAAVAAIERPGPPAFGPGAP
jgi:hypothetical protein